jgi:hypothetical protein
VRENRVNMVEMTFILLHNFPTPLFLQSFFSSFLFILFIFIYENVIGDFSFGILRSTLEKYFFQKVIVLLVLLCICMVPLPLMHMWMGSFPFLPKTECSHLLFLINFQRGCCRSREPCSWFLSNTYNHLFSLTVPS